MTNNAMAGVISAFREQKRQLRGKRPGQFDVFSLFNVKLKEGQHSALLNWLLDADGSHGQGSLFLKAFLGACCPKPELPIPDEYKIQTEFWGGLSAVDILVYRPKEFVLYIENKTTSRNMPGQTDREFKDMRQLGRDLDVPADRQVAVYLTPEGRKPQVKHYKEWRTAAYGDVGKAFDNLLPLITDEKVKFILDDWLNNFATFGAIRRRQMMTQFTEESMLIATNWDTVTDIIRAREKLDKELTDLLSSVEAKVKELEWWNQRWSFYLDSSTEVYIANKRWQSNDGYDTIWIGVENFDAEHIFGLEAPPDLYVWIPSAYDGLAQTLAEKIGKTADYDPPWGYYLVEENVQKCLPERVDEYREVARKQIVDFFDQYAKLLMQFDSSIKRYLKKYKQKE